MSLGNKNYDQNSKLYILKLRSKDAEGAKVPPYFEILEKVDGKWTPQENTITSVSGILTDVQIKENTFDNVVVKSVAVSLKDGNETYILDLRFNIVGRGILNSLVNIQDISKPVEISVYQNKKGYESGAVRSDGEIVSWKFSLDEQPKPEEIKDKKGNLVKRDYTEIDEFFEREVQSFVSTLGEDSTPNSEAKQDKPAKVKKVKEKPVEAVTETGEESPDPLF
jgi:hypothetical protein